MPNHNENNARVTTCLRDLLEHSDAAARLVTRGKPAYDADEMLRYAAEDLLIRMGECTVRIDRVDPAFIATHLDLELQQLRGARNILAHGYDIVDSEIVWTILAESIPLLAARLRDMLTAG